MEDEPEHKMMKLDCNLPADDLRQKSEISVPSECKCQKNDDKSPVVADRASSVEPLLGSSEKREKYICGFFLTKKGRHCRCQPKGGLKYCVEHAYLMKETSRKRIPCPLDGRHSIFEDKLQHHLKRCAAREDLLPVYYTKDINILGELSQCKISVRDVDAQEIFDLIAQVEKIYAGLPDYCSLPEQVFEHEVVREELSNTEDRKQMLKHLRQIASLVGLMGRHDLLCDDAVYVEFGAGKGGLSHWLQLAIAGSRSARFLLVERGSVRYKKDRYHKGQHQGPSFERLQIDIQHLNLSNVPSLNKDCRVIGVGKHVCGSATDLALRCLMENSENFRAEGVTLAPCCHHRCTWHCYVGHRFLVAESLSARHFSLIASMSAWATDCSRDKEDSSSHWRYGRLSAKEREVIGYKCKRILDHGRVLYLQQHGVDAALCKYIKSGETLENFCIVGKKKMTFG